MALSLTAAVAQAAPTGGQVVSGTGDITQSGATTTIQQSSQNLSLNWQSFNIASSETVNFLQPNAVAIAVNRIFDTNGTQILGHLNANGQVYLINPNGILFGQGAQVNVGGLVASTLDFNDGDLNGNTRKFSGNGTGSVINQGTITAANGGYVALLGNHVGNQGVIVAQLGTVALGAGSAATLTFSGDSLVHLQVDESVLNSLAENGGLIRADGGMVVMTAGARDSLLASVVNNTGVIEARTVDNQNGTITLLGGMQAGTVNVDGTLDASAPDGGNGGFIETSAAHVKVADTAQVTTAAANGNTGTWLIDPVDFTIGAGGGAQTASGIGADTLSGLLGSNNVGITTDASTGGNGDIFVNSAVSWSANRLTLSAHRNIDINANLNASGTASLALEYGLGAVAAGNAATYNLNNGARVNLPAGQNFSTRLGSDGATVNYTVITSLGAADSATATDLQGINGGRAGNYVLGADIDAAATSGWNSDGAPTPTYAGFMPIGSPGAQFTGRFDGLGHTISNLTINRPTTDYVGLFGYAAGASIRNVGLVGGSVIGNFYVGGLAGLNTGTISNSYSSVNVSGNIDSSHHIGGLVGYNFGTVSGSYATGSVSGNYYLGGLVGYNEGGTISDSHATGSVTGGSHQGDYTVPGSTGADTGGLVGHNDAGTVTRSYATGNVSGNSSVGGLVGFNSGTVSYSHYSTGTVSGHDFGIVDGWAGDGVGGLVGYNSGAVSYSYATGNVNSLSTSTHCFNIGGLVGSNFSATSSVSNSYATGNVTAGGNGVGGLMGENRGTVINSYATGNVTGNTDVGGLVGYNNAGLGNGMVSTSYARGSVTGISHVGGLVGYNFGTVSGSYWNSTATATGIGGGTLTGATGLSTDEMLHQSNFASLDFDNVWIGYDGHTNPLLRSFMTALTVTANSVTKTYDGLAYTGGNGLSYSATPVGNIYSDALTYGGTSQGVIHASANTYSITASGLYSDQQGYIFSYQAGTLTVTPKALTSTASIGGTLTKTYDGTTIATGATVSGSVTGAVAGDTLTLNTTGLALNYNSAHVAGASTINATGTAGFNIGSSTHGSLASDYSFTGPTISSATGTITAAQLTAAASIGGTLTKTYDGTLAATGATTSGNITSGLVGSDAMTLNTGGISLNYSDAHVVGAKTIGATGSAALGTLTSTGSGTHDGSSTSNRVVSVASDYALSAQPTIASVAGTITAAQLTAAASIGGTLTKTYDGTLAATGATVSGSTSGAIGTDTVALNTSGISLNYNTAHVATATTISATGNAALGTLTSTGSGDHSGSSTSNRVVSVASDYALSAQPTIASVAGTITPHAVNLTGTRTYDGTVNVDAGVLTIGTLVGSETLTLSGTGTMTDKNVGTGKAVTLGTLALGNGTGVASDYTFTGGTRTTNITAKSITVTGITVDTKVYDGTTDATLNLGTVNFTGIEVINGTADDVTITTGGISGSFNNKNVGNGKAVGLSGVTLSGADAVNYTADTVAGVTGNITARAVTLTAPVVSKTYDGGLTYTTTASDRTALSSTLVGGDTVTAATITYADKNAGTSNKAVSVSGVTVNDGNSGNNYIITLAGNSTSTINKANLTLSTTNVSKTYDGGLTATGTATVTGGTLFSGDSLTGGTFAFTNKNVGSGNKIVTTSGVTVGDGVNNGNYNVSYANNTTSTINPYAVDLTGTRTYDGTTTVAAGALTIGTLVGTETLTLTGSGTVANKNVGTGKAVTLGTIALGNGTNGGLASNYTFTGGTQTINITQANLTLSSGTVSKTYDGTTSAAGTATVADGTLFSGDSLTGGTFAFTNKNVGSGNKTVTTSGVTVGDGINNGNYNVSYADNTTSTINQANLTLSTGNITKAYDGTTSAASTAVVTGGHLYDGDALSGGTFTFDTKNVGSNKTVTVAGVTVGDGVNNGNYNVSYANNTASRIVPLVLVGDSINYPAIPSIPKSPLIASGWPGSVQAMSQSGSLSADVATLAPSIDSVNGVTVAILDGGVRMPDDRKDH